MTTAIANSQRAVQSTLDQSQAADLFQKLVIAGDLSTLSEPQRVEYYKLVCEQVGLNPYHKPFDLLKLSGKLTLYANKGATSQLTALHNLRVTIVSKEIIGDQYVVTARCEHPSGATSEDIGAVPIKGLSGDAAANAIKKALTQAKRRAIMSACGFGMLDETEVTQVPGAQTVAVELPAVVELSDEEKDAVTTWCDQIAGCVNAEELTAIVKALQPVTVESVKVAAREAVANKAKALDLVWNKGAFREVVR